MRLRLRERFRFFRRSSWPSVGELDQQRRLAHGVPVQRERLLRSQPRVRHEPHEHGAEAAAAAFEVGHEPLDLQRCQRTGDARRSRRGLAHRLERIECDVAVLDGVAKDALEHRHRLDDGRGSDARRQQLAAEGDDPARVDLAHRQTGKTRGGVCFPQTAIDRKRRSRELGHRALDPPLLEERTERLGAGLFLTQLLRAPAPRRPQPRSVVQRILEAVEAAPPARAVDVLDADAEDLGDRSVLPGEAPDLDALADRGSGHGPSPRRGGSGRRAGASGRRGRAARRARSGRPSKGADAAAGGGVVASTVRDRHQSAASLARIRSPQARLAVRSPRATARRTDRASTRMRSATSTAVSTAAGSRSSNGVSGRCAIGCSPLMSHVA